VVLVLTFAWAALGLGADEQVAFSIADYTVSGNTLISSQEVETALKPYKGKGKTAEDVEEARDALEKLFHQRGYPTVLVNIPEQSVDDGVVRLEVIASKIRKVRVTGNRYFTMETILGKLPSLAPGQVIYLPKVQEELAGVNRNADIKVAPVLQAGPELGLVDLELQVKDRLPLHASLELNNRSSWDTTELRLNGSLRYDHLWQKEHSASVQYQISPQDADEVNLVSASYVFPTPWNPDHMVAAFAAWSDSQTAFGEGLRITGKGALYGLRYVMGLPPAGQWGHSLTLGLDLKDFNETLGFATGEDAVVTPITYLPLSASYGATLPDAYGVSRLSAGVNMAFRNVVADQREFEVKRFKALGNYIYATAGIERVHKLPWGMDIFLKIDGQIADQPLIANEQCVAGGMDSVRGYKESEEAGDDALHTTLELGGPQWSFPLKGLLPASAERPLGVKPYAFFDTAALRIQDPRPEEDRHKTISGVGLGLRGAAGSFLEWALEWATALEATNRTPSGHQRIHFKVKALF